jgi:hypothetical protein
MTNNWTATQLDTLLKVSQGHVSVIGDMIAQPHPANCAVKVSEWTKPPTLEDDAAAIIAAFCEEWKIEPPVREHRFHDSRKWRFDFAWVEMQLAVEIEGGTRMSTGNGYSKGHAHPERFESDCMKYNAAAMMGWFVLRFTSDMVRDGRMLATLQMLPPF